MIESRPTFFQHVQRKTGLWVPAPLRFAGGYPCCCREGDPCTFCLDDNIPDQMQLTVSGNIYNRSCPANDCATYWLGNTFVCDRDDGFGQDCGWSFTEADAFCTDCMARVQIWLTGYPGNWRWYGRIEGYKVISTCGYAVRYHGMNDKPNCMTVSGLVLETLAATVTTNCSVGGAILTLSTVP